jgi:peptide/nickel transport system permease protein
MSSLLQGDLGESIRNRRPVLQDLKVFFPATLELTLASMAFCLMLGLPLGILAAVRRNRLMDHLTRIFSVIGVSTPVFWLGLMLPLVFYRHLDILPGIGRIGVYFSAPPTVTGMYLIDSLLDGDLALFRNAASHIILPAFCLSYVYLAIITRIVRSSLIDSLEQDYIVTARANGIPEWRVVGQHALKNSLIPTITIVGLSFGELLGGAILTETIFNWPGMGKYVVDSANYLDYPAIMAVALVSSLAYVFLNLLVDALYALVNPQIRY